MDESELELDDSFAEIELNFDLPHSDGVRNFRMSRFERG